MCLQTSYGLKDRVRDVRLMKMIQVVGSHKLLNIQKQLQKFVNRWPETMK
jgi:hypothetical protein